MEKVAIAFMEGSIVAWRRYIQPDSVIEPLFGVRIQHADSAGADEAAWPLGKLVEQC
jgi:hypothetical protein